MDGLLPDGSDAQQVPVIGDFAKCSSDGDSAYVKLAPSTDNGDEPLTWR